jgi:tRNA-(ms[2]io[6]A)-hydroxylase
VDSKRRLPVLKTPDKAGEEEAPVRPPWQWIGFGTVAIFVVWLPLAFLAGWVAVHVGGLSTSPVLAVSVLAAGLALAALAGGFLVGRWGADGVGVREAALAGLAAALVATGLSLGSPGALAGALPTAIVAVSFASLGGWLGLRRRPRTPD